MKNSTDIEQAILLLSSKIYVPNSKEGVDQINIPNRHDYDQKTVLIRQYLDRLGAVSK